MLALATIGFPYITTGSAHYKRDDPRTTFLFVVILLATLVAILIYYLWQAIAGHSKEMVEREDGLVFHVYAIERRMERVCTGAMFAGTMAFCLALLADVRPWHFHVVFTPWPLLGLILAVAMIVSVNDRVTIESGRRIVCRSMFNSHKFQIPLNEILTFAVRDRPALRGEVGEQFSVVAVRRGSSAEITLSHQGSNGPRARALSQRLRGYLP